MSAAKHVRIVEDSRVLSDMLATTLELEGIRFSQTTSDFGSLLRPQAWEGISTVLCDLDLGGPITGEMVLEYLEANHPWIKRVVLSAVAEVSSSHIQSLAHVVLMKPSGLTNIVDAIE